MTSPVFCTYFDQHYLSRGLALYQSIRRYHEAFQLIVCCLDEATYDYLTAERLANVVPYRLADLEAFDAELAATKSTRSRFEYYFTTTASWLRFVFARHPEISLLNYVDADFYFFGSTAPIFQALGSGSIGVVEHRFPPAFAHLVEYGRFNVGWLSFRRDEQGLACIEWWRERCIEWCYDRIDGDRFADQKYLDQWPTRFPRTVVIGHRGVNVAPWNLHGARVESSEEIVTVEGDPLVCFHFHGLKHTVGPIYTTGLFSYRRRLDGALKQRVYRPYLDALVTIERDLQRRGASSGHAVSRRFSTWRLKDAAMALASRTFLLARMT